MKRNFLGLITMLALVGCAKHEEPATEEKKSESPWSVSHNANGEAVVTLNAETQTRVGLKTENLVTTEWTPEVKGYGRVIDPATLAAAVVDFETTRATADVSSKELERLKALSAQGNASARMLQSAEATGKHDELAFEAARAKFAMDWGKRLADNASEVLKLLADGQGSLVRIDLPAGQILKSPTSTARIVLLNNETNFVGAEFFDVGAGVDPQTQQQSFLFVAKPALTPGAAVSGALKIDRDPQNGATIPANAILRHEGKAWFYLQTGEGEFTRREIMLDSPANGGWFSVGLSTTNQVVITGAQMLLSTEASAGGFSTGERD